jgi:NTE family protein
MPKRPRPGTSLALSGGGFRATLFHVGALIRLNELGMLRSINRFVSVSGGSIAVGCLAMNWARLTWLGGRATNLTEMLVAPLRRFCRRDLDVPAILEGFVSPLVPPAEALRRAYKRHLFGATQMKDLPRRPSFIIQATNLATGKAFRFHRDYVADYLIGSAPSDGFGLATAVAASSAFPPVLSPLILKMGSKRFSKLPGADLFDDVRFRNEVRLTDGGVYDNLGLEAAWDSDVVLASDAGAPFEHSAVIDTTWYRQAARALDIATAQARGLRRRWLIDQFVRGERRGAYWGITTRITDYRTQGTKISRALQERLWKLRTRLNCFDDSEQGQLINLGYAMSDAALRSNLAPAGSPFALPFPEYPLHGERK